MKQVVFLLIALSFLFFPQAQIQAAYPEKEILIISSHAAGSVTDIMIRFLSDMVKETLGQPILVSNKPGAGYVIGNAQVVNSKPDGYTLGFCQSGAFAYTPFMIKVPYDFKKDITWIMTSAQFTHGAVVKADAPWKDFKELLAYSKNNPGKIIYTHDGFGLVGHVAMEYIAKKEGIEWQFVPMSSPAKQMASLLGGHSHIYVSGGTHIQFIKDKEVRLLMNFDETRQKVAPDVPTIHELGYAVGLKGPAYTLFGPKGIPEDAVKKLENAFNKAVNSPKFKDFLDKYTLTPLFRNSKQVAAYMESEAQSMESAIKYTGIKPPPHQ